MKEGIVKIVMTLIVLGILSLGIYLIYKEVDEYYYICTDTLGNTIYCEHAEWTKGGMFGTTEDGTRIQITSYKRIKRVEE